MVYALVNKDAIQSSSVEPPLIAAPTEPLKRRPDQPGGMDIPNRDKMVFDLLDDNKVPQALSATVEPTPNMPQPVTVQKLLAQVSSSVSPSAPVSGALVASTAAVAASTSDVQIPVPVTAKASATVALKPVAVVSVSAPTPVVAVKEKPEPKPVAKPDVQKEAKKEPRADAKEKAADVKDTPKGAWGVQIAAVNSKADADALIAKMKGLAGLKGLKPRVVPAPDGKHFRVQFAGAASRDDASAVCAKVAAKTSCMPVAIK